MWLGRSSGNLVTFFIWHWSYCMPRHFSISTCTCLSAILIISKYLQWVHALMSHITCSKISPLRCTSTQFKLRGWGSRSVGKSSILYSHVRRQRCGIDLNEVDSYAHVENACRQLGEWLMFVVIGGCLLVVVPAARREWRTAPHKLFSVFPMIDYSAWCTSGVFPHSRCINWSWVQWRKWVCELVVRRVDTPDAHPMHSCDCIIYTSANCQVRTHWRYSAVPLRPLQYGSILSCIGLYCITLVLSFELIKPHLLQHM